MESNIFRFKHFSIKQDSSAMKVGTDGTLLGAWCNCSNAKNVLDIGTGTGLIALMIAQRNENTVIDAVELDNASANEADYNFKQSDWDERLNIHNTSLQDFNTSKEYDLIVSNPPFFSNSSKNNSIEKSNTRHNDSLPFESLIMKSNELLSERGILNIILPVDEAIVFIDICKKHNLHNRKHTKVYSNINSNSPFRFLLEFSKTEQPLIESNVIIETDTRHQFTDEYKSLCKDFFLKF